MTDLVIRLATAEDKEGVLGIHGNIYDGRDYLPGYYDFFVTCPHITSYVAIVGGKIVGFTALCVVDDGTTVVSRAGRISQHVAGKGIFFSFKQHLLKSTQANINAFTTNNGNLGVLKETFKRSHKLVFTKPMVHYRTNAHDICLPREPAHPITLSEPSAVDLEVYMTSQPHAEYLFPNDVFVVDWVPFKLLSSNIPLLQPPKDMAVFLTDVDVSGPTPTGLLSICTTFPIKDPPFGSNLEIYGTDTASLKSHVLAHIQNIRDRTNDVTSLVFFVEPQMDTSLEKFFSDLGLVKQDWKGKNPDRTYSEQYLFEKKIDHENPDNFEL